MNRKLYVVASLAVFALLAALSWLLDGVVLSHLMDFSKGVWRSQTSMQSLYGLLFLKHFVVSFIFVALFIRGFRNKGWAEGVRYGLVFGMVMATSGSIEKFVLLEIPVQLALGWFMGILLQYMILGLTTALIYRQKE